MINRDILMGLTVNKFARRCTP